jgi:ribosome-associated protein
VLSESQKATVALKLANRINQDGVLRVTSDEGRSQSGNRVRAAARFAELLAEALKPVKKRRPTRPHRASIERRLTDKRLRSARKMHRRDTGGDGDTE